VDLGLGLAALGVWWLHEARDSLLSLALVFGGLEMWEAIWVQTMYLLLDFILKEAFM